jgi:hypothetical protein
VAAETIGYPHARSILMARTANYDEPLVKVAVRYFMSSLDADEIPARWFASRVRNHWNIENGSHWMRDVLWREDGHLMRHHGRAHILSSLRQVALFLLTQGKPESSDASIAGESRKVLHNKSRGLALLKHTLRE